MTSKLVRVLRQETGMHTFDLNVPISIGGVPRDMFAAPFSQLELNASVVSVYGTYLEYTPHAKEVEVENAPEYS